MTYSRPELMLVGSANALVLGATPTTTKFRDHVELSSCARLNVSRDSEIC